MTKVLIGLLVALLIMLFIAWNKIDSLNISFGEQKLKLERAESEAEKNKKLYDDEYLANQENRLLIQELNKELIDAKIDLEKSRTGTVIIGN